MVKPRRSTRVPRRRAPPRPAVAWVLVASSLGPILATAATLDEEARHYRIVTIAAPEAIRESRDTAWQAPPGGPVLEVSGIAVSADPRAPAPLAVATRKGDIWLVDDGGVDGAADGRPGAAGDVHTGPSAPPRQAVGYRLFASGLHEPLGLEWRDGAYLTAQRGEVTRVADTDGDGSADDYATVATGWGVTGHYHEYAYGPKPDGTGRLWVTLNTGLNLKPEHLPATIGNETLGYAQGRWRGWALTLGDDGSLEPVCCGLRSPSGLGADASGAMFCTDQQGNWIAAGSLVHLRRGGFFGHPESLASADLPASPLPTHAPDGTRLLAPVVDGLPWPRAVERMPYLKPPAVWLPYRKAGQSATDVCLDASGGRFGPFAGQLFVGEFTQASIHRVFLERVAGEYQGAVFPFRAGFASAVLRLGQAPDGSLYAGLTNRGWSSLGPAAYGLERLVWTGIVPFEIRAIRAAHDGFELEFTRPVDRAAAARPDAYALSSYTYLYHSKYGSDEIDACALAVREATVSDDGLRVRLVVDGLRPLHVHEFDATGVRSAAGEPLLHSQAFYTLNRLPPPR